MCRFESLPDLRNDREGGAKVEGKIEGRGTRRGVRPGLHGGWRGTRLSGPGAALRAKVLIPRGYLRASPDRVRWSLRLGPL